jgi:putative glycosyltransferase
MRQTLEKTMLSIVTPVYQAEGFIEEFYRRATLSALKITPDYEILFVNDGSTDQSLEKLIALHQKDPHVVIIDLARNFGQPNAIRTGLVHARGDFVFTIDDDLEESPEWLEQFYNTMLAEKSDIVFAAQLKRKGNWFERISGKGFFYFVNTVLKANVIENVINARLMSRRFVDILVAVKERNLPYCRLCYQAGFGRSVLYFEKKSKHSSSYSFRNKMSFLSTYLLSVTTKPLYWTFLLGIALVAVSAIALGLVLMQSGSDRAVLLAFLALNTGIVLTAMGIQSMYLAKVVDEVKGWPFSSVRAIYGR